MPRDRVHRLPAPRVRVSRHVTRLVVDYFASHKLVARLVVDYFASRRLVARLVVDYFAYTV
jgi:hypothetical protein